ncbi:Tetratricopeptide TPR_4 [Anaeromyxobacter sp. K]|uniref:tetratricopeptide repeat protein n=1 Tax=Anaeromyxobacter sp. (strain K) TaxID=447217 RepID=UPI00015F85A1|nr:tetratricopeptide repeat protein [Anaeromyxobacter sp. K]ACG71665.1 Tetratricopeptide TPR_4 [Anaeromyxobacter sp. K]
MSKLLLFYLLVQLTGSPLGALALLLAVWWATDRMTVGVLPDPLRGVARWRRRLQLARALEVNPHDRRARLELADLLLAGRRPARAAQVLRPNVEAGDEDAHTAFLMGAALGRSGQAEPAERALAVARAADPDFRAGEIDLELGRQRLGRGDAAGAREALERLLVERPGSVEGRLWLARALDKLGDQDGARRRREEGWREYVSLPRFHRKHERPFAWRLQPWRPAAVALGVVLVLAAVAAAAG